MIKGQMPCELSGIKNLEVKKKSLFMFTKGIDASFKIKLEILNLKLLNFLKEQGANTVLFESSIYDLENNDLIIEGEFGELIKLCPSRLKDILKPDVGKELNVRMVILAIPNGESIGKVFLELGVKQIFVFKNIFPGVKRYTFEMN